jgi:hypothetical protein
LDEPRGDRPGLSGGQALAIGLFPKRDELFKAWIGHRHDAQMIARPAVSRTTAIHAPDA